MGRREGPKGSGTTSMISHFLKKMRKNKVLLLQFHPPNLAQSVFLALPSGKGILRDEVQSNHIAILQSFHSHGSIKPFFLVPTSLPAFSVLYAQPALVAFFQRNKLSHWNDFSGAAWKLSFPPGSP